MIDSRLLLKRGLAMGLALVILPLCAHAGTALEAVQDQFREVIGRLNQLNETILLRMAQAETNGGGTT